MVYGLQLIMVYAAQNHKFDIFESLLLRGLKKCLQLRREFKNILEIDPPSRLCFTTPAC